MDQFIFVNSIVDVFIPDIIIFLQTFIQKTNKIKGYDALRSIVKYSESILGVSY
jgi:hypothetical protein